MQRRNPIRLKNYDYSTDGVYFITICTADRKSILWNSVGATIGRPHEITLSKYGKITDDAINNINAIYPEISVDDYVIMPNHIHLLLRICRSQNRRAMPAPTISTVVQQLKGFISKQAGYSIWQKLFYDHVVRNGNDYREIRSYIDNNPAKWEADCFF